MYDGIEDLEKVAAAMKNKNKKLFNKSIHLDLLEGNKFKDVHINFMQKIHKKRNKNFDNQQHNTINGIKV